jgi:hypothetical protein
MFNVNLNQFIYFNNFIVGQRFSILNENLRTFSSSTLSSTTLSLFIFNKHLTTVIVAYSRTT